MKANHLPDAPYVEEGVDGSKPRLMGNPEVNCRYQAFAQACAVCSPLGPFAALGSFEWLCLLSHDGQSRAGESHAGHKSAWGKCGSAQRRDWPDFRKAGFCLVCEL